MHVVGLYGVHACNSGSIGLAWTMLLRWYMYGHEVECSMVLLKRSIEMSMHVYVDMIACGGGQCGRRIRINCFEGASTGQPQCARGSECGWWTRIGIVRHRDISSEKCMKGTCYICHQ